jgi:exonuclease III
MSGRLEKETYIGRPYGGVGLLWRKSLHTQVRILRDDSECRCLAIALEINPSKVLTSVTVYFPCCETNLHSSVDLGYCMGFIENILRDESYDVIILGYFNFECVMSKSGYKQCV